MTAAVVAAVGLLSAVALADGDSGQEQQHP